VSNEYLPVPVNCRAAGSGLDFPVDRSGVEAEILIATAGRERHDAALQLLVCLRQIVRESLSPNELGAYWQLLDSEFQAGVKGEIDEEALTQKKMLLRNLRVRRVFTAMPGNPLPRR
jgi:hypothetical protein